MNKELTKEDFKKILYKRPDNAHKGLFGYIALIGGSEKYSGAIKLAAMANASMRAGTGVCKVVAPKSLYDIIAKNILEATFFPLSCNGYNLKFVEREFEELIHHTKAIAIGMGIGDTIETQKAVEFLLKNYEGILIIDADGINALTKLDDSCLKNTKAKVVFTPHLKEFERLIDFKNKSGLVNFAPTNNGLVNFAPMNCCLQSQTASSLRKQNRSGLSLQHTKIIELAINFAKYYNVHILVKGNENVVTDGNDVYIIKKGTPGMATAGSGDVLAGIVTAMLGYNENNILTALAVACYVNGLAGELAVKNVNEISMVASDTVKYIPTAINEILKDL